MSPRSRRLTAIAAILVVFAGVGAYLFWPERISVAPEIATLDASVEKGQYLATIGNCKTCHTARNGKPFAGGVRFESAFGVLYSTNITADAETGIGRWSYDSFYRALKHGVRPDGTPLYPAFPYTSFAKLRAADIASIYLYMRTIEPVRASVKENDLNFPYNLRFALRAWNKLFHAPSAYAADPAQSAQWNRGAYLTQGLAHCGACHTPRNFLGAERNALALSGGTLYDRVRPGEYRQWFAVNLTPAKSGLSAWSEDSIASYLRQGECAHAVVHGPMTDVVMNSTRYLNDGDARAIAHYLKSIPAAGEQSKGAPSKEKLAAGAITYTVHCGTCHLPTGLGDEVMGVTLAGNAIVQAADPASLINVILYGPRLPPPPFVSDRTRMKPFGKRLSDEDVAAVATYVRASFGNQAEKVTADDVKRQR
jgi:mono/diheme cytochrome c family protein